MDKGAAPFIVGFLSGVAASILTAYAVAPNLAERATRKAILRLHERSEIVPIGLLQGIANVVGPMVREETRKALTP
jgi:hypothetical protein